MFVPKSVVCFREGYTRETVTRDVIAGVVVGIVALPLALAFAIALAFPFALGVTSVGADEALGSEGAAGGAACCAPRTA